MNIWQAFAIGTCVIAAAFNVVLSYYLLRAIRRANYTRAFYNELAGVARSNGHVTIETTARDIPSDE